MENAAVVANRPVGLVKGQILSILKKARGDVSAEVRAAQVAKAEAYIAQYGLNRADFEFPSDAPAVVGAPVVDEKKPAAAPVAEVAAAEKKVVAAGSRGPRGLGIGRLAKELILSEPTWTYQEIADEVNRRIAGAHATDKSVRWYSNTMRREGIDGTRRVFEGRAKRVRQPRA